MSTARSWIARVIGLCRRDRTRRFREEIEEHVELLAADHVRRGMTEKQARHAARRDVGNVMSLQQAYREQNGLPLLENIWQDLKFAVRTLRRNPVYAASCIATLAIGLGSMITVLCVVSALLWKPLPYPHPERLVVIKEVDPRGGLWTFSEPDLLDLQQRSRSLAAIAAYRLGLVALTGAGEPETIQAAAVTPSSFAVFGIKPVAGAAFQDSQRSVVIGRGLWKRRWQMDPMVAGQAIALDGESYTIAGVADLPTDILPGAQLIFPLIPRATESRTAHDIEAVGRLRAGVEQPRAEAELNTIAAAIARENPRTGAGWGMRFVSVSDYVLGPGTGRMVWMIFAAVALFWALACANVAGLQMARSISRRHEISTRRALGASRRRLFGQTLTENAVLAFAGSVLGLMIAGYMIAGIRLLAAEALPRLTQLDMGAPAMGIALGCMLLSTVLFTLFSGHAPEFQGGREISRRDRGRDALIVVQVALASVLVLGAGLLLQSFVRLRSVDPGFDAEKILAVHVNLSAPAYDSLRKVAFFREAEARLARLPEVESVGATNVAPFSGQGTANRFRLEGEGTEAEFRSAAWRAVTPGFFTTLGIPLKQGRLFTDRDANGSLEVVILTESMARKFFANQNPIGKRLLWGRSGNPKTIVGVVGDLRDLTVDSPPVPTMFRPFAQLSDAPMTMVIRTGGDPVSAAADVRREIRTLNRNVALDFQPLGQAMSDSILRPRVSLVAVAAFAAIAMMIAAFGLYGLISYRVNQRQQEIGIRLALGCSAPSVRWGVQKRCLAVVCLGLAIGLPLAYALSTLMTSLLYETQPTDATAYGMVLLVFVAVALMASYGPARRASQMDPAAAIRYE
jgi:putative ABC transport system permease protein